MLDTLFRDHFTPSATTARESTDARHIEPGVMAMREEATEHGRQRAELLTGRADNLLCEMRDFIKNDLRAFAALDPADWPDANDKAVELEMALETLLEGLK